MSKRTLYNLMRTNPDLRAAVVEVPGLRGRFLGSTSFVALSSGFPFQCHAGCEAEAIVEQTKMSDYLPFNVLPDDTWSAV